MNIVDINDRDRQMLELLAQGASNRSIADSMGYREGTMRVYLHGLYKKLGVGNKTSAVIWYFDRLKAEGRVAEGLPAVEALVAQEESFGDIALRQDLQSALGAMSMFLGAYGRVWEVGNRLKGVAADPKTDQRRRQSRQLWEALLKGDFAYGKRLFDEDQVARLLVDSPSDCVLLACLLRIGGFTRAADRVMGQLVRRKKGRPGISAKEVALVTSLRDALDSREAKRARRPPSPRRGELREAVPAPRRDGVAFLGLPGAQGPRPRARDGQRPLCRGGDRPAAVARDGRASALPRCVDATALIPGREGFAPRARGRRPLPAPLR